MPILFPVTVLIKPVKKNIALDQKDLAVSTFNVHFIFETSRSPIRNDLSTKLRFNLFKGSKYTL